MGFLQRNSGLGCLLVAMLFLALSTPAAGKMVNRVIAVVDGFPITLYQYEQYIVHNTGGQKLGSLTEQQKLDILDGLITDTLISMQAQQLGLRVTPEDVQTYMDQIMLANDLDQATLIAALAQQGLDEQGYRRQVRRELLKNQLVSRDIRQKVNITDEDVARFYKENPEQFSVPAAVELSHILFLVPPGANSDTMAAVSEKARRAHMRLVSGESFEKVAREMSEAPDGPDGGKIGRIKKGQMMPEIESVAFVLPAGDISHPVRSPVGLHILKVDSRENADLVPIDQIQEQIRERLYGEAIQERFDNWADEDLREDHVIDIRI